MGLALTPVMVRLRMRTQVQSFDLIVHVKVYINSASIILLVRVYSARQLGIEVDRQRVQEDLQKCASAFMAAASLCVCEFVCCLRVAECL